MPLNRSTYANNEEQIYQILLANKFSLAQVCGILANIENECNFNPTAYNSKEGAYGICQWRSGRKTTMFSRYGSTPSLYNQVKFISDELDSTESRAKSAMQVSNNRDGAYNAGYEFADKYERCADQYNVPRAQRAQEYWDYYSAGDKRTMEPSVDLKFNSDVDPTIPVSKSPSSYGSITSSTNKSKDYENIISQVTYGSNDYGYLIDVTYGGQFKFYIPEFSEAAGVNWQDVRIPGRSVSIKSYENTESRKISVSLDLYAGAGLYSAESSEDVVGKLHSDANFVKSLEYPDYSNVVTRPPATVYLLLGPNIKMEGVVSDVTVEHLKPLDSQNRAMYVKLTFTVTQTAQDPPGWQEIRGTKVTSSADNISSINIDTLPAQSSVKNTGSAHTKSGNSNSNNSSFDLLDIASNTVTNVMTNIQDTTDYVSRLLYHEVMNDDMKDTNSYEEMRDRLEGNLMADNLK